MIDIAWLELLHQKTMPLFAKPVDDVPQILFVVHFFDAHGRGLRTRFNHPRCRDAIRKQVDFIVVEQRRECRNRYPGLLRFHAHGQLVAEIAGGSLAHARNAEFLADGGGLFHIEIIECDHNVNLALPHQPRHPLYDVADVFRGVLLLLHIENVIERFPWPCRVAQARFGKQINGIALRLASTQEVFPFEITGDTEKSKWFFHVDGFGC